MKARVAAFALFLALAPASDAASAAEARVLCLSRLADRDRWPARLEDLLNDGSDPLLVVVERALADVAPEAVAAYLEWYSPLAAVARSRPSQALVDALRARGIPLIVSPEIESDLRALKEAARAVRDKTVPPSGAAASAASVSERLARAHLELLDAVGAERHLARRLALAPDDLEALSTLLELDVRLGRYWGGIADAGRLVEAAGASDRHRAEALRDRAGLRVAVGDLAGAESDIRRLLRTAPEDSMSLLRLAELGRDRPEEALRHAERAARAGSTPRLRTAAYRLAGEIRSDMEDESGAEASFARALDSDPDDLESLRGLARIRRKRPRAAAQVAAEALAAAGRTPLWARPDAYRYCARIWLDLGDRDAAADSLRRALSVDPDDLETLEMLVHIGGKAGASAAAAAAAEPVAGELEALRLSVGHKMSQGLAAEAVAAADRFSAAVADAPVWQRAVAQRLSAQLWADLGDGARAFAEADKAFDLDENSLETQMLMARVGRRDSSGPTEPVWRHIAVARAKRALDDRAGAAASLLKALALSPGNGHAVRMLAELEREAR